MIKNHLFSMKSFIFFELAPLKQKAKFKTLKDACKMFVFFIMKSLLFWPISIKKFTFFDSIMLNNVFLKNPKLKSRCTHRAALMRSQWCIYRIIFLNIFYVFISIPFSQNTKFDVPCYLQLKYLVLGIHIIIIIVYSLTSLLILNLCALCKVNMGDYISLYKYFNGTFTSYLQDNCYITFI